MGGDNKDKGDSVYFGFQFQREKVLRGGRKNMAAGEGSWLTKLYLEQCSLLSSTWCSIWPSEQLSDDTLTNPILLRKKVDKILFDLTVQNSSQVLLGTLCSQALLPALPVSKGLLCDI